MRLSIDKPFCENKAVVYFCDFIIGKTGRKMFDCITLKKEEGYGVG